jgi:hypothetical protein
MAALEVCCEPVSQISSLLNREVTGYIRKIKALILISIPEFGVILAHFYHLPNQQQQGIAPARINV